MTEKEWIHFVGIGGTGMSGIAKVLLELGYKVSGSDLQSSEATGRLKNMGALIYLGHSEENVNPAVDSIVVSSAIPKNNAEVVKANALKIPVIQRAEMLGRLMKRQKGVAVAGAHGKTTTSSMIALMFEKNGYDPTVVVGGELNDIGGNAKLGNGEYLVAEADESDGSFLKLHPAITVVTNVENDHLDYYGSRDNIEKAFYQFITATPGDGFAVLCIDDLFLGRVAPEIANNKKVITYGLTEKADYNAQRLKLNGLKTEAIVVRKGKTLGRLRLSIPGKHNLQNALAAIAVGIECGLEFQRIVDSLWPFRGVQRRFQKVSDTMGVMIFDDYAHHPTELKATLAAARSLNPARLIAVFQPHRYTRTHLLADEFGEAFELADMVFVNDIYSAGEKAIPGVDAELIVKKIKEKTGQPVEYVKKKEDIVFRLLKMLKPGDLVITLGAGNIWSVSCDLGQTLQESAVMKV